MGHELISYVALGSNLGDSVTLIRRAMDALERCGVGPITRSSLWRTDPVDCPPGSEPFVNAVVGIRPLPRFTPKTFLAQLQAMERSMGRTPKKIPNEARPLDLDMLVWGDAVLRTPDLVLPHPRAFQRRFVLAPWAEVAPDLIPPGQSATVTEMLRMLPKQEKCVLITGG